MECLWEFGLLLRSSRQRFLLSSTLLWDSSDDFGREESRLCHRSLVLETGEDTFCGFSRLERSRNLAWTAVGWLENHAGGISAAAVSSQIGSKALSRFLPVIVAQDRELKH